MDGKLRGLEASDGGAGALYRKLGRGAVEVEVAKGAVSPRKESEGAENQE